ncbi:acyl-CoA thioesterase [Woodsholea maritima]|uniref:acyl-CoA thioesterase n=1 Tax=Woodsholea maritima TaxID=240237 RepID=UPI0003677EAF|nr:acyl-CoA thioesterase [Woodsholea maritima]
MSASSHWDLPAPFIHNITAKPEDIDTFGHVNNACYLKWADETAWAHWFKDGLTREDCLGVDQGMAIIHSEADYYGHVRAGEALECAVWIAQSDGRLRAQRWYQFRKASTGETVFRARTQLVCFCLSSGKPTRMAPIFARHYHKPEGDLAVAIAKLTES